MVKKENIYFITFVDDNLQDKLAFRDEVISILSHKNGWSKYGYNFICINDWDISASSNAIIHNIYSSGGNSNSDGNNNSDGNSRKYPILKIFLKSVDQTDKDCGMQGFSCTRFTDNYNPIDIIINYDNWCGKSKSSLSIPDYRKYVINHEVGHWLGLDHTECPIDQCIAMGLKECPASIMLQMTRGPDFIKPCKEQPDPLDPIFKIDNPKISKYRFKHGGNHNKKYKYLIILIIILLIFFIIILYINIKKLKITYNSIFK